MAARCHSTSLFGFLHTVSIYHGHIFGGFVRNYVLACIPTWDPCKNDIDIFFNNKGNSRGFLNNIISLYTVSFIDEKKEFLSNNISRRDIIDPSDQDFGFVYLFNRTTITVLLDGKHVKCDIVHAKKLPVDDVDIHYYTVRYTDHRGGFDVYKHAEEKLTCTEIVELKDRIAERKVCILPEYFYRIIHFARVDPENALHIHRCKRILEKYHFQGYHIFVRLGHFGEDLTSNVFITPFLPSPLNMQRNMPAAIKYFESVLTALDFMVGKANDFGHFNIYRVPQCTLVTPNYAQRHSPLVPQNYTETPPHLYPYQETVETSSSSSDVETYNIDRLYHDSDVSETNGSYDSSSDSSHETSNYGSWDVGSPDISPDFAEGYPDETREICRQQMLFPHGRLFSNLTITIASNEPAPTTPEPTPDTEPNPSETESSEEDFPDFPTIADLVPEVREAMEREESYSIAHNDLLFCYPSGEMPFVLTAHPEHEIRMDDPETHPNSHFR